MSETIDEIIKSTEELKALIANDRKSRGLPVEPPPDFLPVGFALVLCDELDRLKPAIAKYAKLLADSRKPIPLNIPEIEKYRNFAKLLHKTVELHHEVGAYTMGISLCLREIESIANNESKDIDEILRTFYYGLKLAEKKPTYEAACGEHYSKPYDQEPVIEAKAQYEAYLADPFLFESDLAKYQAHYESIKHLI